MHAMEIEGIIQLHDRVHVPDLRAGATMVLGALAATGRQRSRILPMI